MDPELAAFYNQYGFLRPDMPAPTPAGMTAGGGLAPAQPQVPVTGFDAAMFDPTTMAYAPSGVTGPGGAAPVVPPLGESLNAGTPPIRGDRMASAAAPPPPMPVPPPTVAVPPPARGTPLAGMERQFPTFGPGSGAIVPRWLEPNLGAAPAGPGAAFPEPRTTYVPKTDRLGPAPIAAQPALPPAAPAAPAAPGEPEKAMAEEQKKKENALIAALRGVQALKPPEAQRVASPAAPAIKPIHSDIPSLLAAMGISPKNLGAQAPSFSAAPPPVAGLPPGLLAALGIRR